MSSKPRKYKPPYPRTRLDRNFQRSVAGKAQFVKFGSTAGTFVNDNSTVVNGGIRGVSRRVSDIVTPGFAEMRDNGHVLNNPFDSVSYRMDWGGVGPVVQWTAPLNPWPSGNYTATYPTSQLHTNSSFVLLPFEDAFGYPYVPPLNYTGLESLRRAAKTEALSNVDQSIAQGLVGIVELKRTLLSLVNPLSSIQRYIDRWKLRPNGKNRKKLTIREGDGLVPSLANQYLELYYGLMPTVRDIESYLEAYVHSEIQRVRQTARGQRFDTKETSSAWTGSRTVQNSSQYDAKYTCVEELCCRSGILYEPTPTTLNKVLGLRWGDVFPAAYEIMPWSFFLDYFSNLGTLIEALTPRQGVSYLAAWDTVIYKITWRSEVLDTWVKGSFTHARVGTEWSERVLEARSRTPTGVYANIGLVAHTGVWESKAKVAAVLSLLLQQLGPKVIPPAIWKA